jgi:hypothetical protein
MVGSRRFCNPTQIEAYATFHTFTSKQEGYHRKWQDSTIFASSRFHLLSTSRMFIARRDRRQTRYDREFGSFACSDTTSLVLQLVINFHKTRPSYQIHRRELCTFPLDT